MRSHWGGRWVLCIWFQEFTNLRQHINQQHMHGDRPPLLTFYVGKIPACLTCSPALHFLENQMFRCKIWNKGVFARKSGSAKRLRGGEGGCIGRCSLGGKKSSWRCWCAAVVLLVYCVSVYCVLVLQKTFSIANLVCCSRPLSVFFHFVLAKLVCCSS